MPHVATQTIPFGDWETWVRVTEPSVPREGALPLVVLHGGPGMAHNYVRNLEALADTGRRVIHYDQLGCGNSTHLPDAPDCAIIEAVEAGKLGEAGRARLDSLQRLLETFAR